MVYNVKLETLNQSSGFYRGKLSGKMRQKNQFLEDSFD